MITGKSSSAQNLRAPSGDVAETNKEAATSARLKDLAERKALGPHYGPHAA